jgi:hypothetical protein
MITAALLKPSSREFFDKAECLATPELTEMGRPGLDPGTRELI